MKHLTKFYYFASLLMYFLFSGQYLYADGSKDLYPNGVNGNRAFMVSKKDPFPSPSDRSYPFVNLGVHYVYAKAGESIAVASSAQGIGSGQIYLTRPDGVVVKSTIGNSIGQIGGADANARRANELSGARVGYTPFNHVATDEGIYKVEFVPTGGENSTTATQVNVKADAGWTQASNSGLISAWDVSIFPATTGTIPIQGRVYSNVFTFLINGSTVNDPSRGFNAVYYVLTSDGYVYKVDNNGNNGVGFTSFVNNQGFTTSVSGVTEPSYKSMDKSFGFTAAELQDPRNADVGTGVTHKMFYTIPASDLPTNSTGAVPGGGSTWLKKSRLEPQVDNLDVEGVDGTTGQVSSKGGFIKFNANLPGRYTLVISSRKTVGDPLYFPSRTIKGNAVIGVNSVRWDGKDGGPTGDGVGGNPLPQGNVPANLTVQLQGAEVHFPYIDMEINPNGIKLELLKIDNATVESDIVYWDDINVTGGAANQKSNPITNLTGLPSGSGTPNGHKWGTYTSDSGSGNSGTGLSSFGNDKAMDTWTYVLGEKKQRDIDISVKIADLEVVSITTSSTIVKIGDDIVFTVIVRNNGASDVTEAPFAFNVPTGFEIVDASAPSSICAAVEHSGAIAASKTAYNSKLDLTNGCAVTYIFKVRATAAANFGSMKVDATIMRPNDVTDPDATSTVTPTVPPTDPYIEINNNGLGGISNNVKTSQVVTLVDKLTAVKSIVGNPSSVRAGQVLTYEITLTNNFGTARTGVTASDVLPSTLTGATGISHGGLLTGQTINWTNLTVPANGTLTLSFTATVVSPLSAGTTSIKNTAAVVDPIDPATPINPEVDVPTSGKLTAVKSIVGNPSSVRAGQVLTYEITLTNNFGTAKTGVTASDVLPSTLTGATSISHGGLLTGQTINWTNLTVPANGTLTLSFTVNASGDIPSGVTKIKNTAAVVDPIDPATPVNPEVEVPIIEEPALKLIKHVTNIGTGRLGAFQLGDPIEYTFTIKNTGDVILRNIILTDPLISATPITISGSILPGAELTHIATYNIVQTDVDAGNVTNSALAKGRSPAGIDVTDKSGSDVTNDDPTVTPINQSPALSLTKTAIAGPYNKLGDIISYNLVVKNTGNVTVTAIAITDANADAGSILPATIASLAPNATANVTAKHTVTQADLDRGYVTNIASADGKDPKGGNVHTASTDPAPVPGAPTVPGCTNCTVTPIEQKGAIVLVKKVTNSGTGQNGVFVLGDKIEYTFTITNTGNVSLKDLVLSDPLLNKPAITIPGTLAPKTSVNHIEEYRITASDVIVGKVTNVAVINSTDSKGGNVKDDSGTATDNNDPTVTIIAKPPVAKDDVKETPQNKPVVIEVLKNDEAGSSPIVPGATTIVTQPKNGTVVVNTDGTVTYTPNKGYTGTDEFTYSVTDKNGQISNPAKVTLTVVPTKPEALDETVETQWNTEIKIPVLANDKTDGAPFDEATLEITEQPKHGTLKINPDGTVVYLPYSGYTGPDTFKYRVKDEYGNWTNVATVNISVKGFFIPNVITPNGDGKNDTFVIVGLENFGSVDVTIFNRWGNEVYRNNNYKNTWTGEGLNSGTYYYLIRLSNNGKQEVYKGWVLLKR